VFSKLCLELSREEWRKMKTKSKIGGYLIRSGVYAVFLSVAFIALSSAFNSPNGRHEPAQATAAYDLAAKVVSPPRALSFAERVAYQRVIEDVYWRHRIWPKENPDPKPSLDAVMCQTELENKVAGYLHDSLVLEDYWRRPITAEQLQAEMDRMARDTKQPEVLQELFEALGNDPAVIAECLARPILAERLIADVSAQEQTRQVESPQLDTLRAMSVAKTLHQLVYTLPRIADATIGPPCTDNTWTATTSSNAPEARGVHTAVWTGSEMIVWGGLASGPSYVNTGATYNPSTDSWAATSLINAPAARDFHTAVWTGSEMIVWGGWDRVNSFNTGGRYNPGTNTWTATTTINAPSARDFHTAVWTGSEMIVWGGFDNDSYFNTGGRYNPGTNTWTATSTTNAPDRRYYHTAVWTGSEMIVWGGYGDITYLNTGGRYNPSADTWTPTSTINTPSARQEHKAVWTDSEMIVWGGWGRTDRVNTGGKYNPSTDHWIVTSTTNAPTARTGHTAVWTSSEMIVWGGFDNGYFSTGGKYDPGTNTWTATSTINAPSSRYFHTAVWTGSEMIIWGGGFVSPLTNTGGRYCAQPPTPTVWPSITPRPLPTFPPRPTYPPRPTRPPR
jgi:N-acetylneuraminic acid mutarotase